MLLSHSCRVICELIDHLASLQENDRPPVQPKPTNIMEPY